MLANSPRFSAHVASKAASTPGRAGCAGELSGKNIAHYDQYAPVKTPMIAPTKMYDSVLTPTPEGAADLVVKAIIERPSRIASAWASSPRSSTLAPKATKW